MTQAGRINATLMPWLLALLLPFPASTATADEDHVMARKLLESGQILSLEKIMEHARRHKVGDILETELENKRGRYIYEVELLDSAGQVWELELDAASGKLISVEREH